MSTPVKIYFDFLNNLFAFLFLCAFLKNQLPITCKKHTVAFLLVLQLLYAIPQNIPFNNLISFVLNGICIFALCYPNYRKMPFLFLKFELIDNIFYSIIFVFHSFLLWDFSLAVHNTYYLNCKHLLCVSLLYVFYVLYTNSRQMKKFHTHYHYYFNAVLVLMLFTLSCLTLYLLKSGENHSAIIPMLFSIIYILVAACISIYKKFTGLIEENLLSHIQLEKYQLTQQYAVQVEENIKQLHSLRHDMKNHLLIIDGYAARQDYPRIHQYIIPIIGRLSDTAVFDSPSDTVSALVNSKYQTARSLQIDCDIVLEFPYIHIDDFTIITILGNLFDNALTAAAKCEQGFITLSIRQLDTYLEIILRNNHQEQIQEKNGCFTSTKPDRQILHGIGIKNVRSAVAALNGQIDISYTDHDFSVNILIPNY